MAANALAAGSSIVSGLATWLTGTIGTVLLVIISIMVVRFAVSRRFMELGGFLVLAVVVFLVFFHPTILENIAGEIASAMGA
jgi:uncharacterized membrane protein